MKTKRKTVRKNFRFTVKLAAALRRISAITGKSQTRLVIEALNKKLGLRYE